MECTKTLPNTNETDCHQNQNIKRLLIDRLQ